MFQVCVKCGTPAILVNKEAVENKLGKELTISDNDKLYACPNSNCKIVYFSKTVDIATDELIEPIFFKDSSDSVPICYCSGLTRGEIKNAVNNGCKTIDEVQDFSGKNITGNCKEKNPLGQCCHNSFLFEIQQALDQKPSGFNFKPCS